MAMEAHHLLHTEGRMLTAWEGGGGALCCDAPAGTDATAGRQSQLQGYQHRQSSCVGPAAASAPGPMMTMRRYGQAWASESGGAQEVPPRKRKRAAEQPRFIGLDAAHLQQQLVDVDRLVLQHTAEVRAELAEQRRRHAWQVVAAAAKRLRAKDEEIGQIGRLNWALEERVRSLSAEAQVWRDLALSNEAAANALRGELQLALDAHQARRGVAAADDAASCCCGEGEEEAGTTSGGRRCAVCGVGAAEVLLLPCRHLCACAPCAGAATACPACGCAKNGSVCVNFS